ncbi:hypothetical protein R1sor_005482 [Riccia sorocarpa]|uniref:Uncharacterized protein n=1 Tax=Riccia sorocarpa TaxID=122646 RepID=A0ABD3HLP8_9MARC
MEKTLRRAQAHSDKDPGVEILTQGVFHKLEGKGLGDCRRYLQALQHGIGKTDRWIQGEMIRTPAPPFIRAPDNQNDPARTQRDYEAPSNPPSHSHEKPWDELAMISFDQIPTSPENPESRRPPGSHRDHSRRQRNTNQEEHPRWTRKGGEGYTPT